MQSWLWSLQQTGSFAPILADQQVDFEQTDQLYLRDALEHTDILFYAHPATRDRDAADVAAWLRAGRKTLVTHSYIPLIKADGLAFQNKYCDILVLWNRSILNSQGFLVGYGPHLLPDRGPDQFNLAVRPYPYKAAGAKCAVKVPVQSSGAFRVYSFLEDREAIVIVGNDKLLSLSVNGAVAEQFYFAPDAPEFLDEIARLKRLRKEVSPFLSTGTTRNETPSLKTP